MRAVAAVLAAGFIAGTLDLTSAFIVWREIPPLRLLQHIASGLLGRTAFSGGTAAALLGILLHYCISCAAAAAYYAAARLAPVLIRHAVPFGVAYGAAFYLFMSYIVVPLSQVPRSGPVRLEPAGWFAHIVLFGLPIAITLRSFWKRPHRMSQGTESHVAG